jgi:hypothetical protein
VDWLIRLAPLIRPLVQANGPPESRTGTPTWSTASCTSSCSAPSRAAVTPPHADSPLFVVLTFTISKVGIYHMNRVKIGYATDGHRGWQYQNIDTTFKVVNPPLPGPVPIPRSGICG